MPLNRLLRAGLFLTLTATLCWPTGSAYAQSGVVIGIRPISRDAGSGTATTNALRAPIDTGHWIRTQVPSTRRGAVAGAITGGTIGLVGGTIVASSMATLFGGPRNTPRAAGIGALCAVGGAISWGLIGAGLGSLFHHYEWKRLQPGTETRAVALE